MYKKTTNDGQNERQNQINIVLERSVSHAVFPGSLQRLRQVFFKTLLTSQTVHSKLWKFRWNHFDFDLLLFGFDKLPERKRNNEVDSIVGTRYGIALRGLLIWFHHEHTWVLKSCRGLWTHANKLWRPAGYLKRLQNTPDTLYVSTNMGCLAVISTASIKNARKKPFFVIRTDH